MMRISEPKTVNTGSVVNHLGYKALRKIFADIHDIEDRLKQVTSLCTYPAMSDHMPEDVVERTMEILEHCPKGSVGSVIVRGNPVIRQHIADYISQRDLVETSTENIWITGGVLPGVSMVLDVLKRRPSAMPPGIITCVPQYMGYATLLEDQGFCVACYYLDEDRDWVHNTSDMQKALDAAKSRCVPRCFLLVNPANPPSTVMSECQLQEIIRFAYKNQLIILADEIFEFNVYTTNHPFHSVRKVMNSMGAPYSGTQLVTFNSISKGFTAEVGLQAGYFEAININRVDQANLEHATMEYLPPMLSQVALDCMIKPPRPGGASYELYTKEKSLILDSLAERARLAEERLNAIDGIHCSRVQGSMAAYPRVTIPVRAIEEAERREMEADVFYAEELLRRKGVSVTPSSAFGRLPGKFHMRIVILPPKNQLLELFDRLESFQKELMAEYS
ncbi:alanine aminotransferase 2 isoform X2 [Rhipicephalus microplus]|uniref:alanine aminotransferase 2 isoform X2 n=1 Tax=Rhipicephalus microplus TaxID=6941 RepID=UPI0018895E1E|nr:alanine aminotransferase 2-like isoform X2 [Rhipicephalus microplus]